MTCLAWKNASWPSFLPNAYAFYDIGYVEEILIFSSTMTVGKQFNPSSKQKMGLSLFKELFIYTITRDLIPVAQLPFHIIRVWTIRP